jgi:sugar/nucleoside kinase (ribokinase family)
MSILCVGQCVADIVVRPVDVLPVAGRAEAVEDLQLIAGGCAANTAAVLAKLGAPARLAARIGVDALGNAALADLEAAGVRVDAVVRDPDVSTSAAIVLVGGSGERSFWYRSGGNERLCDADVPDELLRAARIVHVGGAMKLLGLDLARLMARAKHAGCLTSLDTDWDIHGRWMRALESVLPHVDCLLTNEEEAAMLTGIERPAEAGHVLLGCGPTTVVVKRGRHGAMVADSDGAAEYPTYDVDVFDTTCAGDAFAAGFLFGLSRDWPRSDAMRLANAAGALCTTQLSHRGIASLEDAQRLMESHRAAVRADDVRK